MRPIPPSMNCQHQANSAYDKLAVISENMPKLLEIEQFIFELKQWLRAYIDAVKNSLDENSFAKITENNIFTGINTFSDVHLYNGNIYWVDSEDNTLAWITYDPTHQLLTLHVNNSELTLSPNLACTVPTNAEVDNSIVTYAFLHGLLEELEARVSFTKDTTITEGSNNIPTTDAVYQFVTSNQFHLTLDDTVTQNSSNGVKSSGIYAALQELDTNLRILISALNDRISAIESSSGSSSSKTWGVKKFNTVRGKVGGQPTMSVGQTVSEGKIVRIYALTHWTQTSSSGWDAPNYTDWYYIWKDDNYTLTNADKSKINSLPSQLDYGSTPWEYPHVTLSYNSGNV